MPEAAAAVEASQARLEVDVDPVRTPIFGRLGRPPDQRATDAPAPEPGMYRNVEQEGVDAAVPRHVGEADQTTSLERAHVSQAATEDPAEIPPRMLPIPGLGQQAVEVLYRHPGIYGVTDPRRIVMVQDLGVGVATR